MKNEYPLESQIPALKKLWARCFPDPEAFIDGFFDTGFSPRRCRCIMDGQGAAAALYWFDGEYKGQKLAYLYAIATDPEYRGRGLCRKLVEDAHRGLKGSGYAGCLLLPGEPGLREMYRKFGYRDCCEIRELAWKAGEEIPVTAIGWEEYARLRLQFLPDTGAVQEGLEFLETYAGFYRGEGFLLAAAREDGKLLGLELLGRQSAGPGILAALNCREGTFRGPGTGKPGAMFCPLTEDAVPPDYFGLTFD